MHKCGIGPLFFTQNTITANIYLNMTYWIVLAKTDVTEREEKVKFCFNKAVLHTTSIMRYERP
jgi:hypothetical protein